MELQKTIAPPLAICGSAFWTVKNAPFVLIANVLSKSSSLHSATVPRDKIPAFTKRMSIFPNFDLTSLMNAIFICPLDRIMSGDSWWAVEINVRCGDVTHRWAAQQCLIRMVRLQ